MEFKLQIILKTIEGIYCSGPWCTSNSYTNVVADVKKQKIESVQSLSNNHEIKITALCYPIEALEKLMSGSLSLNIILNETIEEQQLLKETGKAVSQRFYMFDEVFSNHFSTQMLPKCARCC